jgi:hypothetical protein
MLKKTPKKTRIHLLEHYIEKKNQLSIIALPLVGKIGTAVDC